MPHSVLPYNNVGLITKGSEDIATETLKIAVFDQSTVVCCSSPENPLISS